VLREFEDFAPRHELIHKANYHVANKMRRRDFIKGTALVAGTAGASLGSSFRQDLHATLILDMTRTVSTIPPDFMGLGYEISSVARPGLLSGQNSVYVQLCRTLGSSGIIRVGGNTSDYASYSASGAR
jgi:hypothetical protein